MHKITLAAIAFVTLAGGVVLARDAEPEGPVITLQRERTYAWTAAYVVGLFRDGRVVYIGGPGARVMGVQSSTVEVAVINELLAEFDRIGFAQLQNPHDPGLAEKPSTHVTLHTIPKTVSLGGFGPVELAPLVRKIEKVTNLKQWVCPLPHPYPGPKCFLE